MLSDNNPVNFTDPTGHRECGEDCDHPLPYESPPVSRPPTTWPPFTIEHEFVEEHTSFQWFGNTEFALSRGYTGYCGYYHCGLDFMATSGTPVYAGVYGEIIKMWCPTCEEILDSNGNVIGPGGFGPSRIDIRVWGNDGRAYTLIFAHLDGDFDFNDDGIVDVYVGQDVTPDTRIGGVGSDPYGVIHLHVEITDWQYTYNPLPFFSPEIRDSLVSSAMQYRESQINLSGVSFVTNHSDFLNQPWRICRQKGEHVYMTCN